MLLFDFDGDEISVFDCTFRRLIHGAVFRSGSVIEAVVSLASHWFLTPAFINVP